MHHPGSSLGEGKADGPLDWMPLIAGLDDELPDLQFLTIEAENLVRMTVASKNPALHEFLTRHHSLRESKLVTRKSSSFSDRNRRIEVRINTAIVAHVAGRSGGTLPGEDLRVDLPDHFNHLPGRLLVGYVLSPILRVVAETAVHTQRPGIVLHDGAQIFRIFNLKHL